MMKWGRARKVRELRKRRKEKKMEGNGRVRKALQGERKMEIMIRKRQRRVPVLVICIHMQLISSCNDGTAKDDGWELALLLIYQEIS